MDEACRTFVVATLQHTATRCNTLQQSHRVTDWQVSSMSQYVTV